MEKADILELTVNYVKQLHQQQQSACVTDLISDSYLTGYADCIHQINKYINGIGNQQMGHKQKELFTNYLTCILAQQQSRQKISFSTFSAPPSPAPSFDSSLSLSTNTSSPDTNANELIKSTKNNNNDKVKFNSDVSAEDDDSFENVYEDILVNNSTDLPLNLKVIPDDDVWRPW